jgi:uncharacterized protein (UPF0276 family)
MLDDVLGIGLANDLCEPGALSIIHEAFRRRLCGYLTLYLYENYTPEFLREMRRTLPPGLRYVWHAGGEFELPYAQGSLEAHRRRLDEVAAMWAPAWATEDVIVTNFGRTEKPGHPNFVQLLLTEECLEVCVRRMKEIARTAPMPFFPEVPHFYAPGPDEMHLATFFRRFVEQTGARLNFDIGHYFSYNLLRRLPLLAHIDEFPLEAVAEINTAGGLVGDAGGLTWIDDYAAPINPLTIDCLRTVLPRCTGLRAMYTETIGAEPWVVFHNLQVLNQLFWPHVRRLAQGASATAPERAAA